MTLDFDLLKRLIEQAVTEIENEYKQSQGLILTEGDLKCLLYSRLIQNNELSQRMLTQNHGIYAKPVHSELSWYDENNKLSILPDITIIKPENLSILSGHPGDPKLPNLPSKQYRFRGSAIIFELKFIRNKTGITPKTFSGAIEKDFLKIKRLHDKLFSQGVADEMFCYFIIFNKTDKKCQEFERFFTQDSQSDWHKVIYCTGDVRFH